MMDFYSVKVRQSSLTIKVFDAGLHAQRSLSKKTVTTFLMKNFDHVNWPLKEWVSEWLLLNANSSICIQSSLTIKVFDAGLHAQRSLSKKTFTTFLIKKNFDHVNWPSKEWVSEWLLLNANSTIFQLYHGENKLIINGMMMRFALY
jgi:hypothetical protein